MPSAKSSLMEPINSEGDQREAADFPRLPVPHNRANNWESMLLHCGCMGKHDSHITVGSRTKRTATAIGWEAYRSGCIHGNPSCCSWIALSARRTRLMCSLHSASFISQISRYFRSSIDMKCLPEKQQYRGRFQQGNAILEPPHNTTSGSQISYCLKAKFCYDESKLNTNFGFITLAAVDQ